MMERRKVDIVCVCVCADRREPRADGSKPCSTTI